MGAAHGRVANVVGTGVPIAELDDRARARAVVAGIARGAGVAVVAELCVRSEHATRRRITGVVGARIVVDAAGRHACRLDDDPFPSFFGRWN